MRQAMPLFVTAVPERIASRDQSSTWTRARPHFRTVKNPSRRINGTTLIAAALAIFLAIGALVPTPALAEPTTFVSSGDVWRYEDGGSDLGTAWRGIGFDDSSWASGPAQLGFGNQGEATVTQKNGITTYFRRTFTVVDASEVTTLEMEILRDDGAVIYLNGVEVYRTNMPGGVITYRTRASTDVSGAKETQWYLASLDESLLVSGDNTLAVEVHDRKTKIKDLSFDLQLNGQTGTPPPDTEAPYVDADFSAGATVVGDPAVLSGSASDNVAVSTVSIAIQNVLTNEWLQSGGFWGAERQGLATTLSDAGGAVTSWSYSVNISDGGYWLFVDATDSSSNHGTIDNHAFTVDTPPPPQVGTFVSSGDVWRYEDGGSDLGTAWRGIGFDDSSWASGPAQLGFGNQGEATVTQKNGITTYFRRTFTVVDASEVTTLEMEILRDDGAVIYLNGVEVYRTNMPGGVITYRTRASTDVSGAKETQWYLASLDESLLVSGDNTLAVEVHDRKTKIKDLSFDLQLNGQTGTPPPPGPTAGPRAITCPAGAVDVLPGSSIAAAAANSLTGTTFCIKAGMHQNESIQPKDGQSFIGEIGSILDGSDLVAHAFFGGASAVTIENLVIQNYSTNAQFGAVNGEGDGWRVAYNDIRNNAGVGVFIDANQAVIQNNFIHHNHQLGISLTYSLDSVVENNDISYNNWLGEFDWGWEAGGTKFWSTTNLVVRGNDAHDNLGPGLWSDTDNTGILYEYNDVHENRDAPGIFHEVSYDAIIRNNHIWDNGWPDAMPDNPFWQRAGIEIAGSSNVEISDNLIEDSAKGIVGIDQCVGSGAYGVWQLVNVWAHDNIIDNSNLSTAESDCGSTIDFVFENNTLMGNSYILEGQ